MKAINIIELSKEVTSFTHYWGQKPVKCGNNYGNNWIETLVHFHSFQPYLLDKYSFLFSVFLLNFTR